jgi:uncharacterized protein (TIGR02466 family)
MLKNIFETPMWHKRISPKWRDELKRLTGVIKDIRDKDPNSNQSQYLNGYTTYYSKEDILNSKDFINIKKVIETEAQEFMKELGICDNIDVKVETLFGNINGQYSAHSMHIHEMSHFSGSLYLDANIKDAKIGFLSPSYLSMMHFNPDMFDKKSFKTSLKLTPRTGDILIFPSWLLHEVEPQQQKHERVCVAFNIILNPRRPV